MDNIVFQKLNCSNVLNLAKKEFVNRYLLSTVKSFSDSLSVTIFKISTKDKQFLYIETRGRTIKNRFDAIFLADNGVFGDMHDCNIRQFISFFYNLDLPYVKQI